MPNSQSDRPRNAPRVEPLKTSISVEDARKLAKPQAGFSVKTSGIGFAGLKTDRLFSEEIKDENVRFNRLESAVQATRDELNKKIPAIDRLVAMEKDIENLVSQLETLLKEEKPTPPALNKNAKNTEMPKSLKALAAKSVVTKSAPHTGAPILQKIRMSDNHGTMRIVMETDGAMKYTADLDNEEKILVLSFKKGSASAAISKTPIHSRLIHEISTTPQKKGLFLVITLNSATKIVRQGTIDPGAGHSNYRSYIDLQL